MKPRRKDNAPSPVDPSEKLLRQLIRETRVEQVITNLLSNAVTYGEGRPITITVRCVGARAEIVVADQGIGIAPEALSRIFERFERAASGRQYGGLGLGLWIVRQLVEAMDGSIGVESALGRGSTFTVRLPI